MLIGNYLRALREHRNMSQGDVEGRTGLLRCYISRVENGHTVPAVETLEKFARALEVPLYAIFYGANQNNGGGSVDPHNQDARRTRRILNLLEHVTERDRRVLFALANALSSRRRK